jgi:hypothetical protein
VLGGLLPWTTANANNHSSSSKVITHLCTLNFPKNEESILRNEITEETTGANINARTKYSKHEKGRKVVFKAERTIEG